MMDGIVCEYCGTHDSTPQRRCSACGAPLSRADTSEHVAIMTILQRVRQICKEYEDLGRCQMQETVVAKKLRNTRDAFRVPEDEKVIMLCDDTVLGTCKLGFAICEGGIFWRNHWSLPTKRTRLTWREFAEREIRVAKSNIALGSGDAIGAQIMGPAAAWNGWPTCSWI